MYQILFSIGRLNIYTHGLLMAIGAIFGGLALFYLARKQKLETNFILDLCVYSLLAGIIGARILFVIFYFDQFQSFREMISLWYGGLVSYGGLIGGFLMAGLYLKMKKQSILKWFDLGVIALLIGWAFGRVGCLLNGDSIGIISQSKMAVWGRLPTQIFESVWVLVAAVLCYFGLNLKDQKKWPDGLIFTFGVGLYALGRFVIDFFRDEPASLGFLKDSQIASLIVMIFAIFFASYLMKNSRQARDKKGGQSGSF